MTVNYRNPNLAAMAPVRGRGQPKAQGQARDATTDRDRVKEPSPNPITAPNLEVEPKGKPQ